MGGVGNIGGAPKLSATSTPQLETTTTVQVEQKTPADVAERIKRQGVIVSLQALQGAKAQPHAGARLLYDRNAKPGPGTGGTATDTARSVSKSAPVRVADGGDDLNLEVRTNA